MNKTLALILAVLSLVLNGGHAQVHRGSGQPVGLIVRDASNNAVWGLNQIATAPGSGSLSGNTAIGSLPPGLYTVQFLWHSTSSWQTTFANGVIQSSLSVGATPAPGLTIITRDALDNSRSRRGVPYGDVTLVETYSASPAYTLADRYDPATSLEVEVRQVLWSGVYTEVAVPRAGRSLGVGNGVLNNAALGLSASPVVVYAANELNTVGFGHRDMDRFSVLTDGTRVFTRDIIVFGDPVISAVGPTGTVNDDPVLVDLTFTATNLYPVNWTWLEITTPSGVFYQFQSGLRTTLASSEVGALSATAPSGDPSNANSNSIVGTDTLVFSLNLERLRLIMGSTELPEGPYSFRVVTRTPNALSSGGGWGNDDLGAGGYTGFTFSHLIRMNGMLITP